MSFLDDVARASALLATNGRVSLRGLRRQFDLDDDTLDELVEELVDVMQVARREGNVLVWPNGDAPPAAADAPTHRQQEEASAVAAPPPEVTATVPDAPCAEERWAPRRT